MKAGSMIAVMLMSLAGCAVAGSERATEIGDDQVPYSLLDPEAPAAVPIVGGRGIEVCLLDGEELVVTERRVDEDADLLDIVSGLSTTSGRETAAGLQTAVGGADEIHDVTLRGGIAAVDFTATAAQTLTQDPLATIAQIVCTLTRQPGIGSVRFTAGRVAIDVPRSDGSLTDAPVAREDYESLLATS